MTKYYYKNIKQPKLKMLKTVKKGCLITLFDPTDTQLHKLAKLKELDSDLLKDGCDMFEVPRVEIEEGSVYIFTRFPSESSSKLATSTALFILSESFTTLVVRENYSFFNLFLQSNPTTTQKTKLLISVLSYINKSYRQKILSYSKEIRQSSKDLEELENKDIARFVNIEKNLNDYISSLSSINSFLKKLLNKKLIHLYEEDQDLIEDLELGTQELIELGKSNLKYIVNVRESYNTILNNNLNKVIKLLTALTLIFTVPTFIASFYGMNVNLPFMNYEYAWILLVGVITSVTGFTIAVLIKNKLM